MATKAAVAFVTLKPLNICRMEVTIEGISPLISHKWAEKALKEMRDKHGGKKTKDRDVRDPEQEALDAMYVTDDGQPGVNAVWFKTALVNAAHKDLGIEKVLVRKAVFIEGAGVNGVIPLEGPPPIVREDAVRVGMGGTDLRYRPQFDEWKVNLTFQYDADLLQPGDIINLLNRAGFGVGVGEWRPEKGGDFGRFRVVTQ